MCIRDRAYSVQYESVIDFLVLTKSGKKAVVVTKLGQVEIISLKSMKSKKLKAKCNKRSHSSGLVLKKKELLYIIKDDVIGIFSLKFDNERQIKLPHLDSTLYSLHKMRKTKQIILRSKGSISIMNWKGENELALDKRIAVKGEITALAVTDKYLVYAASDESAIFVLRLPSFELVQSFPKDFEVYAVTVEDENVIAAGANVFAVYDLICRPCLFSLNLWDLEASSVTVKETVSIPTLRQVCKHI
eukprot:TRINITY_DN10096_c0_g1_i4.p1 TRINITY_DN10096_c0_g1~~TRINITY_DN10096_c0_g1_i4.p1  ORF type:complete len:245 (+),score=35.22 TRINITY_DN10096_c0_g1_i4:84-818(+)